MSKVVKKTLKSGVVHTKLYRLDDGSLCHESYKLNGEYYREDGPAYIYYYRDGSLCHEEYWLNGKEYNGEEYKAWLLNKEADEAIQTMLEQT